MNAPVLRQLLKQRALPVLSRPWPYVLMSGAILTLDYATGPFIMFPILFVIPVTCAAWFYTARCAYALAVLLPVGRFIIANWFEPLFPTGYNVLNALIRIAVLGLLAYLVVRTARQTRQLERQIKQLEGILPVCMFCKRIRDEHQTWQPLENYIVQHSEAGVSHGLCPECAQEHYGEYFDRS